VRLEKGKAILLDANGNVIQAQPSQGVMPKDRAQITSQVPTMITARKFIIDGFPIFIDPTLAVITVEQGQATFGGNGGVLEAQLSGVPSGGERLVYFATIVNDVYAYYATGVLDGKISLTPLTGKASEGLAFCPPPGVTPSKTINCFPTTQADLTQITTFAGTAPPPFPTTFPDGPALAIEVKSAWVEAAGLPNLSSYITMTATIPNYTQTSTATWTQNGQKTVQLALVGMHVVGSADGHPEMIWATFEHVANTPRAPYQYINTSGATVTVSPTVSNLPVIGGTSLPWLFSAASAPSPSPGAGAFGCNNPPEPPSPATFNNQNMSYDATSTPPTIVASPTFTISPSNTIRWKAFGGPCDVVPNPIDFSTAASNTEIISINNSIRGAGGLASGDVRGNYVLTGATWTVSGMAPTPAKSVSSSSCANSSTVAPGCAVGTSALSNTTMETYQQGGDNTIRRRRYKLPVLPHLDLDLSDDCGESRLHQPIDRSNRAEQAFLARIRRK
jgi:hypothetical protein